MSVPMISCPAAPLPSFSRYATTPQFPQELPKVTGLLAQLQASHGGAKHLVTLLAYLAKLFREPLQ